MASEDDFFFFFLFLFFLPVVGDPGVNTFLKSDIFGGWFVGTVAGGYGFGGRGCVEEERDIRLNSEDSPRNDYQKMTTNGKPGVRSARVTSN